MNTRLRRRHAVDGRHRQENGETFVPGDIIFLNYDADNTSEDCDSHTGSKGALGPNSSITTVPPVE